MKRAMLFWLLTWSVAGFCQVVANDQGGGNNSNLIGIPKLNLTYGGVAFPSAGSFSGHGRGNSLSAGGVFDMLSNRFNLNVPVKYHYTVKGINFQAGLLTNSRQPKLGAGLSSPSGFNFSAGYGVGMTGFNRMGYSPINSKTQGIQFTAGYRLFGKRR